jgi:outer membrane protein TolC
LVAFLGAGLSHAQVVTPSDLTLGQALQLAEKNSPSLKAFMARERQAKELSRAADSGFFPSAGLDAVDSSGFPGSSSGFGTSGLDSFPGMVASPYRQGPAASAYAKWDLLDLSVWHRSSAARYEVDASLEGTKFQTTLVDQQALNAYLEAVRLRGGRDAWKRLADELAGILNRVRRFVNDGQYSEDQGLLIEDQLSDASLRAQDFDRQYQAGLRRLALLTGMEVGRVSCPPPSGLPGDYDPNLNSMGFSPLVRRTWFESKSAEETAAGYSAENLPVLEVAGSAGYLSGTRLEEAQDYSVFIGVSLPLFEGFRIDAQEKAAKAEAEALNAEADADQLALDDLNIKYSDDVERSREELKILDDERQSVEKAVSVSKERYLTFLGPLSNFQQALKDRVNMEVEMAEAKTSLWSAVAGRFLLNGGYSDTLK